MIVAGRRNAGSGEGPPFVVVKKCGRAAHLTRVPPALD